MKKQLLKFGLMAGIGAFALAQTNAKNVMAHHPRLDSTTVDTVAVMDTASFIADTANLRDTAARFTRDTASFARDTALLKDTASFTFKVAGADTLLVRDTVALKDTAAIKDTAAVKAFAKDTAAQLPADTSGKKGKHKKPASDGTKTKE